MPETLTPDQLVAEARSFLDANAKPRVKDEFRWGEGSDNVGLLSERTPEEEAEEIRAGKAWKALEFDAGFTWLAGPVEHGGRGLTNDHQRAYDALKAQYDTPSEGPFGIGLGMVAPTILAHATTPVKEAYLRKLWRGDLIACQLFSEPVAGSDLAGLQTKAERDGDEWIVNGQKVWTSGAQYSDIGEIICRTDPELPKHKGLTGFVVDMKAPGVEVRPLRQMTGGASFNEVFFTDVRVPDDHRLGDVNGGWTVALTTLMNERAAIGAGGVGGGGAGLTRMLGLVRWLGLGDEPLVRQELADLYIHLSVAKYNNARGLAKIKAGQLPGPEMSVAKLSLTRNMQRMTDVISHLLGARLTADTGEWGTFAFSELVLGVPGMRVAGGTDEVMKNIIGERVLGLSKEPGLSK
jgi:alkylation response protein AidB-like acyl-CoA dehydrogenase